jgi:hypothetical protein
VVLIAEHGPYEPSVDTRGIIVVSRQTPLSAVIACLQAGPTCVDDLPVWHVESAPTDRLLSVRERQVLGLVASGLSPAQAARALDITTYTVRDHISPFGPSSIVRRPCRRYSRRFVSGCCGSSRREDAEQAIPPLWGLPGVRDVDYSCDMAVGASWAGPPSTGRMRWSAGPRAAVPPPRTGPRCRGKHRGSEPRQQSSGPP